MMFIIVFKIMLFMMLWWFLVTCDDGDYDDIIINVKHIKQRRYQVPNLCTRI